MNKKVIDFSGITPEGWEDLSKALAECDAAMKAGDYDPLDVAWTRPPRGSKDVARRLCSDLFVDEEVRNAVRGALKARESKTKQGGIKAGLKAADPKAGIRKALQQNPAKLTKLSRQRPL